MDGRWTVTAALLALGLAAPSAHAAKPNLRVVKVVAPATADAGSVITLRDTTRNVGPNASKASVTAFYLRKGLRRGRGDERLGARELDALKAKRKSSGSEAVELAVAPGRYRVVACADDLERVRESSERDNCKVAPRALVVAAAESIGDGTGPASEPDGSEGGEAPGADGTPDTQPEPELPPRAGEALLPEEPPPPPPPPPAPSNLVAFAQSDAEIDLSWPSVTAATGYKVFRDTASGGPYALVGEVTETHFNDTGLQQAKKYFYVVVAVGDGGDSDPSREASATTDVTCPDHVEESLPVNLGSIAGDSGTPSFLQNATLCRSDRDWYRVRVTEGASGFLPEDLSIQFRLSSGPLGSGIVSLQLCVWIGSPGGNPAACTNGTDTRIVVTKGDNLGPDDSFDAFVRVGYVNPTTQSSYVLLVSGNVSCLTGATCVNVP